MKNPAYIRQLLSAVIVATLLSACHSSRTTVRGSSGSTSPVTQKVRVDEMRRDVNARDYDITLIKQLVDEAARWLGTPYRYAGSSTDGTDCSGMICSIFRKIFDVSLPRNSAKQQEYCKNIGRDKIQPGDLVFFATGSDRRRVSHVGLYIGNGDMIHASSSRGVIVSNLDEKYYATRYHSSGRIDCVDRLYASAPKSRKKAKKDVTPDHNRQPSTPVSAPTTVPDAPEITLEQFINENPPAPLPQISDEDLDRAITEKVDSIFTNFFD